MRIEIGLAVVSLALLSYVLRMGAVIVPDSIGYLDHWIIRPPLLPWLLDLSRWLCGPRYLLGTALFQSALLLAAVHFLCRELRRAYALGDLGVGAVYASLVLVMAPTPMLGVVGAQIASEALAYSLFLVHVALLVPCLREYRPRRAAAALMVAAINILAREQMFFAFAVTVLLLVVLYYRRRGAPAKTLLLAVLCLAGSSMVNGAYHRAVNGSFSGPSWLYPHLWASLIFISHEDDARLYAGDPDHLVIEGVFRHAEEHRLFAHHRGEDHSSMSRHYMFKMPEIFFGGIVAGYARHYGLPADDSELFKKVSDASRRHVPTLLARKYPQYAGLCAIKLLQSVNALDALLLASFLVAWLATPRSALAIFLGMVLAMLVANRLLLASCNQVNPRYLIYTTSLSLVGCVLLASHWRRHPLRFVPEDRPGG